MPCSAGSSSDAVSKLDFVRSLPGDKATPLLPEGAEKPSTLRLGLACETGGRDAAELVDPGPVAEAAEAAKGVLLKLKVVCCRCWPVSLVLRSAGWVMACAAPA